MNMGPQLESQVWAKRRSHTQQGAFDKNAILRRDENLFTGKYLEAVIKIHVCDTIVGHRSYLFMMIRESRKCLQFTLVCQRVNQSTNVDV